MAKGVFSNTEIIQAIEDKQIIIYPYYEEEGEKSNDSIDENNNIKTKNNKGVVTKINTTSVDVRLGEHFFRINNSRDESTVFNPFSEADVNKHFEQHRARPLYQSLGQISLSAVGGIPKEHPVIRLEAGERILGHTYEFIGIARDGTSSMQARSTVGRSGINVCQDAGWGDCGYVNRWTMEIYNNNNHLVFLPVGMRIAQIVFYHSEGVESEYSLDTGKYQNQSADNIEEIIAKWKPSDMLPKAYKDKIMPYKPLDCD